VNTSDAKQKWCPLARTIGSFSSGLTVGSQAVNLPAAINRNGGGVPWDCKCLAEECMFWRRHALDSTDGFCGAAGNNVWST
jgi:hypothetical protein